MCTLKDKILENHPCANCIVKMMCGNNLCEDYSLYYNLWKDRTHAIMNHAIHILGIKLESDVYDRMYWYIMEKFINVPDMPGRIIIHFPPEGKAKSQEAAESYYRQLFFKHYGKLVG